MRRLLTASVLLLLAATLRAQDVSKIAKAKPFTISGSVGGGMTFYHSTENQYTQPPFAWNLYANFTPTVYSFSFPFSFVLTQYSSSYTTPFAQLGVSPTYKWIRLDLGYRTITMSPLVFGGQTFLGATTVTIKKQNGGAFLMVSIWDNGSGIHGDVASQLFKPFTTGGRAGGAGLGLCIARDLVRAHGGEIVLAETGPGGTAFHFTLPV